MNGSRVRLSGTSQSRVCEPGPCTPALNLYKATSRINWLSISCARASTVASEVLTEAQSFCWLQIKHPNRLLASALSNFLNVFLPGFLTTWRRCDNVRRGIRQACISSVNRRNFTLQTCSGLKCNVGWRYFIEVIIRVRTIGSVGGLSRHLDWTKLRWILPRVDDKNTFYNTTTLPFVTPIQSAVGRPPSA